MKHHALAVIAALSFVAGPALAKPAGGEVELHIEASAQVPPDRAEIPIILSATAPTEAEARADLAEQEKALIGEAAKLGIEGTKIRPLGEGGDGQDAIEVTETAMDAACAAAEAAAAAAEEAAAPSTRRRKAKAHSECAVEPQFNATKTLIVQIDGADKLEQFLRSRPNIGWAGGGRSRPSYSQSDPAAARRKARELALAKARAEADGYAAAMGYRVVSIRRVSNARPVVSMYDMLEMIGSLEGRMNSFQPGWFGAVATETVAIDFVIVPK